MKRLFKRAAAIILSTLLMIPSISSIQFAEAATTNEVIVVNENFEDSSIDPQIQGRGATLSLTTQSSENKELTISGRKADWNGLQIPIDASAASGASITASVKVRSDGTGSVLGVQYEGTKVEYIWIKDTDTTTLGNYVELSGTFLVPAGAKNISVYVQGKKADVFSDIMIDDIKVSLIKPDAGAPGEDSNFTTIVEDFEGSSSTAIPRGDAKIETVAGAGVAGSKALFVSERQDNWHGVQFNGSAYVGKTIQVSAQVKNPTNGMKLSLQYKKPDDTQDSYDTIGSVEQDSSDYVTLSGTVTIPAGSTNVFIYAEALDKTSSFYIDNFTLKIPKATEPGSGSEVSTFIEDFEGESNKALARSATIEVVTGSGISGSKALLVSGRTDTWQGVNFDANAYVGKSVQVSAQVKSTSPKMKISLQYDTSSTQYKTVAEATTGGDNYVTIAGTYDIPSGITKVVLYIEATDLSDFYVDNFTVKVSAKPTLTIQEDLLPLKDHLAKDTALAGKAGVAIPVSALDDEVRMKLVTKHYNSITLENEMKPESILGSTPNLDIDGNPILNFTNADKAMDYILQYNQEHPSDNILVRGHVLLWHSQTPTWFFKENYSEAAPYVSKEVMLQRLEYYIKSVLEHYDGKDSKYAGLIYAWDVVNEQIDNGGLRVSDGNGGISNYWQVFQGDNIYVKEAFRLANKYAPATVKLFYNDYGETDGVKAEAIRKLIIEVKQHTGTRLDGMGMQAHYNMQTPAIDSFEAAVRTYAAVVDEIHLTELDFQSSLTYDGTNVQEEYTKQAYRYKAIFDKLYELKQEGIKITSVTLWGTHDGASWLNNASFVGGGADGARKQCPLLFDNAYQAKPAYYAIVDPSQLEPFTNNAVALYSASSNWTIAPSTTYTSNGTEVSFQTLWTMNDLKIKVFVKDNSAANGDKITVYVDAANSKSDKAFTPVTLERSNAEVTAEGYVGIISIPLSEMKVGKIVGIDIAVINNGVRLSWNDLKNTQDTTSKYYGEVTLKPYAELDYGTATIDGELDTIWAKQSVLPLTVKTGSPVATANVRAMWDEEYLYVYADVTDPVVSKANSNPWEQDSLEIFLDQNNAKSSSYQADDSQYRINFENTASFNGTKSKAENLRSFAKVTDQGYVIEAAIKWTDVTPATGSLIGVDFQINDDAGGGNRAGTYNWYDEKGSGYANPAVFGTVTLIKTADNSNGGNPGDTGNPGNTGNPGGTGNSGDTGNPGDTGNTDNTDNTGNSSNTDNSGKAVIVDKTIEEAAKESKTISNLLKDKKVEGVVVSLTKSNTTENKVSVTVTAAKPGKKVYIYRVNEKTGKLETVAHGFTNKVDKNGKVTFTAFDGGNYVVLTKKADSKLVTPLREQIKVKPSKSSLKIGKTTSMSIDLPNSLELGKTLSGKTSNASRGAVVASYKVSDSKVATVDKNGKITAKKAGKVTITTTVKLYNNTTKTFKTVIDIVK